MAMPRHGSVAKNSVSELRLLDLDGQPVVFRTLLQDYVLLIFLRHLA
jgi:hypothetical protein